ncbi:MAG: sigma-70 family RNA polymerase sigma factor, partial [Bacteroidota bacterium]
MKHIELVKSVANGDREAFRQLYELFSDKVYNTALSYVQVAEEAEEITQDVFLSIFRNAAQFRGNAAVNTWVYRITVNTALNYLKKRKRLAFMKFGESQVDQPDFEHP